jgi:predicted transcriptional regulator with HTH domain
MAIDPHFLCVRRSCSGQFLRRIILFFYRRLSFALYISERTTIRSQDPEEKYGSLHTLLRCRDGRVDQPGLCSH